MIPNPIRKVLSSIQTHQVQCLLMGGQACVLYGAAEFSRDTDVVILAESENLTRLQSAWTNCKLRRSPYLLSSQNTSRWDWQCISVVGIPRPKACVST